jgi:hypothetical protein
MDMSARMIIHKSHLRTRQVTIRSESGLTLHSHATTARAIRWCQQHGYTYSFPMPVFEALLKKEIKS